jgi:flagellar hook-associated protein 1 FlgK
MASHSLGVQQQATEVAGQNLANVNNPAYARQQLNIQSATAIATPQGQEGTGVIAVSITQIRSAILDNQVQAEGSVTGALTAQQNALQDAEAALGEQLTNTGTTGAPESAGGLTADISDFFNSLQSLSTNPADLPTRQEAVQSAQQLTGQFNSVAASLSGIRTDINTSITSDVAGSNQDLATIASLNQQIIAAQSGGGTANDLIDLRQQKLEDLSGKVNLTTSTEADGAMDITIGGVAMVTGTKVTDSLQTVDAGNGQLMVQAQNAGTTLSITGGSIGGNIETRDGALLTLQNNLDTLAGQMVTQFNSIYSAGIDLNGNSGQNLFTGTDAATIGVNANVVNDPSQFQAAQLGAGPGDGKVALQLAQLGNQAVTALNGMTYSANYAQTVSGLGASLASVNDGLTNSATVSQMLTTQRDSVSGVSTDDELTNLVQFQKAYQASAEVITTINQMLETLITMKTV